MHKKTIAIGIGLLLAIAVGCGEAQEAPRHELTIVADGTGLEEVETNEGYRVELEAATMRFDSVEFTVGGEDHGDETASVLRPLRRAVIGEAIAHPNHSAGGEIGGAIEGPVVATWRSGELEPMGTGEFLEGSYAGYNVRFGDDGGNDLAPGTMARLEGVAVDEEGDEVSFFAEFDHVDTAEVIGGALAFDAGDEELEEVGLRFLIHDEWSGRSLFDDVDFSRFDDGSEGRVEIEEGSSSHTLLRLGLLSHEFYGGRGLTSEESIED